MSVNNSNGIRIGIGKYIRIWNDIVIGISISIGIGIASDIRFSISITIRIGIVISKG